MSAYLAFRFASINKDLGAQLEQVQILSEKTLKQEAEKKRMLENRKEELEKEVAQRTSEVLFQKEQIEQQHEELKLEKKKSDDLLLNILPSEIADELKENGLTEARLYNNVTVLFTDFVNFTKAGERMSPRELVSELHACFKAFDEIIGRYGIEKIKTIGDAYLAVSGLPHPDDRHALHVIGAAMEIREFIRERKQQLGDKTFEIRIGIHSGPVVAGIVGVKKFAYDIWGDTVNTAARMEQSGVAGKINISASTYELIKDEYECAYRGEISAKNKGELKMYFVEGNKLLEVA
jgi:class 3 adenylate cyclase